MRVVILGCGRVGAKIAAVLDADGHDVLVIDQQSTAFNRLSPTYRGRAMVGMGIDVETLTNADLEHADVFIALSDGDNTNVMAAQVAKHVFHVPQVISQIKDPIRGEAYEGLGIMTICPTCIGADAIREAIAG